MVFERLVYDSVLTADSRRESRGRGSDGRQMPGLSPRHHQQTHDATCRLINYLQQFENYPKNYTPGDTDM